MGQPKRKSQNISGTLLLELSANQDLTTGQSVAQWTFDDPYMEFRGAAAGSISAGSEPRACELDEDNELILVNVSGWYQIWYSLATKASETGYKGQVGTQIVLEGDVENDNFMQNSSIGELQIHLSGAVSLEDRVDVFLSPPVWLEAGEAIRSGAYSVDTAGSTGHAIVTANTYLAVVRLSD